MTKQPIRLLTDAPAFPLESQGLDRKALTDALTALSAAAAALAKIAQAACHQETRAAQEFPPSTSTSTPEPAAAPGNPQPRPQNPPPQPQHPLRHSPDLTDAIHAFLVSKQKTGRDLAWIRTLRSSLTQFAKTRSRVPLDHLSPTDIQDWVYGQGWNPRTITNRLGHLREFFRHCIARGWVRTCPVSLVERPTKSAAPEPGIHTPDQVQSLLNAAARTDLSVCRFLAIRYFAGLRTSEACRITEANIKGDWIEIPASVAKTRYRRLIPITGNLQAWLDLGGTLPMPTERRARRIAQSLGIPWPHNATRHSWVSYHLALNDSASTTSAQAGHSEEMLFRHYRALATKEAARAYFLILPPKDLV